MGRKQARGPAALEHEPDLANQLYVAVGKISRALRRDAGQPLVGHGALSALTMLSYVGPMRPGELATRETVSAASMTRIIAALERVGYVSRQRDPDDGRAFLVEATEDGHAVVRQGRAVRVESLRNRLDRLTPQELGEVVAALPALEKVSADD